MISTKRIEANRRNAARSTGPPTIQGTSESVSQRRHPRPDRRNAHPPRRGPPRIPAPPRELDRRARTRQPLRARPRPPGRHLILAARPRRTRPGRLDRRLARDHPRRRRQASAGGSRGPGPTPPATAPRPQLRPPLRRLGRPRPPGPPRSRRPRRPRAAPAPPRVHRRRLPMAARPLGRAAADRRRRHRLAGREDGPVHPPAGQAAVRCRRRPPGLDDLRGLLRHGPLASRPVRRAVEDHHGPRGHLLSPAAAGPPIARGEASLEGTRARCCWRSSTRRSLGSRRRERQHRRRERELAALRADSQLFDASAEGEWVRREQGKATRSILRITERSAQRALSAGRRLTEPGPPTSRRDSRQTFYAPSTGDATPVVGPQQRMERSVPSAEPAGQG